MAYDPLDVLPFDDGPIHEPTADERDPVTPAGDPFYPPATPTLVHCLHCHEEYESYLIAWRVEPDAAGRPRGMWRCPVPGCTGAGFGFDLFPIDPDFVDPDGRDVTGCFCEDDEDDEAFDADTAWDTAWEAWDALEGDGDEDWADLGPTMNRDEPRRGDANDDGAAGS